VEYASKVMNSTIWIKFKKSHSVEQIAKMLEDYGDIQVQKDTELSAFVEFSFIMVSSLGPNPKKFSKISAQIKEIMSIVSAFPCVTNVQNFDNAERYQEDGVMRSDEVDNRILYETDKLNI
jgi:hypothetical protein